MLFPDGWPDDLPQIMHEWWELPPLKVMATTPNDEGWLLHASLFDIPRERNMREKGLYDKFTVYSTKTGAAIHNTFVLLPERDPAARVALKTYATAIYHENKTLAEDLKKWVKDIEGRHQFFLPPWANVQFEHGSNERPCGMIKLDIAAGRQRGKTTIGVVAGIRYWESYPNDKRDGFIVVSSEAGKDTIMKFLVEQFDAYVANSEGVAVIKVNGSSRRIHIAMVGSSRLEGRHDMAWMFYDNIDRMPSGYEFDDAMLRIGPSMMIVSQSKKDFTYVTLKRQGWGMVVDPSLT